MVLFGHYISSVYYKTATIVHIKVCNDKAKKVFPIHIMKAYRGNRGVAPLILNFGSRQ